MSGTLPYARSSGDGPGAQCLYPVKRVVQFSTDVALAVNQSEQRFKRRPPLTSFVLPYKRVNRTDMLAFRDFHASQRGTFDSTWSFTLGSTTYSNMVFEDAVFVATEEDETRTHYSFTLKARQTKPPVTTAADYGGTFPTLANGAATQFPYGQTRRFSVMLNENAACGIHYGWTWFGGGLTDFPTGSLWGWSLGFPNITDADLATLETFFRQQWGRWGTFSMTDPEDGSVHTQCRFDQDVLEINHMAPDQNSVTLNILETN